MNKVLLIIIILIMHEEAFACSCLSPTTQSYWDEYGTILYIKVTKTMDGNSINKENSFYPFATASINKIYKADGPLGNNIILWDYFFASCSFAAIEGVEYIVAVEKIKGKFHVPGCGWRWVNEGELLIDSKYITPADLGVIFDGFKEKSIE